MLRHLQNLIVMKVDERRKQIIEHLSRSTNNELFLSPKKKINPPVAKIESNAPVPATSPTPEPDTPVQPPRALKAKTRKQRIMDHVSRTSKELSNFALDSEQRKQQIQKHLRITKG